MGHLIKGITTEDALLPVKHHTTTVFALTRYFSSSLFLKFPVLAFVLIYSRFLSNIVPLNFPFLLLQTLDIFLATLSLTIRLALTHISVTDCVSEWRVHAVARFCTNNIRHNTEKPKSYAGPQDEGHEFFDLPTPRLIFEHSRHWPSLEEYAEQVYGANTPNAL